jgi:hypothetical protein
MRELPLLRIVFTVSNKDHKQKIEIKRTTLNQAIKKL